MGKATVDLVTFLKARLDEDEAAARDAYGEAEWEARQYDVWVTGTQLWPMLETSTVAIAAHIARHDPARVLREVAAVRAILDRYAAAPDWTGGEDARLLAAIWSDHPDYRPDWGPSGG